MSVYFMVVNDCIKVGFSIDPIGRASSVTFGNPKTRPKAVPYGTPVEVLGWFPGDRRTELLAHAALNDHWIVGEWFTDCAEVRNYLHQHEEAVIVADLSALAMFAVLRGVPLDEAKTLYPLRPLDEALDRIVAIRRGEAA